MELKNLHIIIDSGDLGQIVNAHSYGIAFGTTLNPTHVASYSSKLKAEGKNFDMFEYGRSVLLNSRAAHTNAPCPVSFEVIGTTEQEMVEQGLRMYEKLSPYGTVWIKIPVNPSMDRDNPESRDGLRAIERLSSRGIAVNCTLIHTPEQALEAAEAGAKVVSPFIGRFDDYLREQMRIDFNREDHFPPDGMEHDGRRFNYNGIVSGVDLARLTRMLLDEHNLRDAQVLAASIRNYQQLEEVACLTGADMATLPFAIIEYMWKNKIASVPRNRKDESDPANTSTYRFTERRLDHPKTLEGMIRFTQDGNSVPEYRELFA